MGLLYKWIVLYIDEVKDFLDQFVDVEDIEGIYFLIVGYLLYFNFSNKNSFDLKNEIVKK